jgi:hypothetical protein
MTAELRTWLFRMRFLAVSKVQQLAAIPVDMAHVYQLRTHVR